MARRSRFGRLAASLGRRRGGVRDPRALAAWIGDRKYGKAGMARRRRRRARR